MPIPNTGSSWMTCCRPTPCVSLRSATCCCATSTLTRPSARPRWRSRTPCSAAAGRWITANLPWATFLDPEVATVGISEAQAKAENLDHRCFKVQYADVDRALIDGRTHGFAKVVASPSGKILGATILGEEASLVLQQLVLAADAGLGLGDLAATTQIYPTYARIIGDLADQFRTTRLDRGFLASALKFFYGFQPRTPAGDEATAQDGCDSNGTHADARHPGAFLRRGSRARPLTRPSIAPLRAPCLCG